jgi:hypothetical protein
MTIEQPHRPEEESKKVLVCGRNDGQDVRTDGTLVHLVAAIPRAERQPEARPAHNAQQRRAQASSSAGATLDFCLDVAVAVWAEHADGGGCSGKQHNGLLVDYVVCCVMGVLLDGKALRDRLLWWRSKNACCHGFVVGGWCIWRTWSVVGVTPLIRGRSRRHRLVWVGWGWLLHTFEFDASIHYESNKRLVSRNRQPKVETLLPAWWSPTAAMLCNNSCRENKRSPFELLLGLASCLRGFYPAPRTRINDVRLDASAPTPNDDAERIPATSAVSPRRSKKRVQSPGTTTLLLHQRIEQFKKVRRRSLMALSMAAMLQLLATIA